MSASSPKGPWTDPLGKPMLSAAFGKSLSPPATFRDPCVFQDPDSQEHYIIAGVFQYYVMKLSPDMISLAETPKLINFTDHVYGNSLLYSARSARALVLSTLQLYSRRKSLRNDADLANRFAPCPGPCGDGNTDDKPFLHKNAGTYYLSWGCFCECCCAGPTSLAA